MPAEGAKALMAMAVSEMASMAEIQKKHQ